MANRQIDILYETICSEKKFLVSAIVVFFIPQVRAMKALRNPNLKRTHSYVTNKLVVIVD